MYQNVATITKLYHDVPKMYHILQKCIKMYDNAQMRRVILYNVPKCRKMNQNWPKSKNVVPKAPQKAQKCTSIYQYVKVIHNQVGMHRLKCLTKDGFIDRLSIMVARPPIFSNFPRRQQCNMENGALTIIPGYIIQE